ncbi:hypothetical protein KK083_23370 [Fulvivirgaceae bacterium PWU4]|uniref:HTH luxR-type domain-containing protein n=1 Tax=Chryseosolibacter histidini TaxID=2782349 RepID=A0AAP2GRQ3_9BACT|nr:LuxR C-terminal-related transcriptional regulator [Chryseosolibacter histidini]MBT1699847.1 hypothetical protein [Chryseosolibacter histidini]
MRFCFCTLLAFVVVPVILRAQPVPADSLESRSFPSDTAKINYWIKWISKNTKTNTQRALDLSTTGLSLARKAEYRHGEAKLLRLKGLCSLFLNDHTAYLTYADSSAVLLKQLGMWELAVTNEMNLGSVNTGTLGNYGEGFRHYKEALEIAKKNGIESQVPNAMAGMAGIYLDLKELDKALKQYLLAMEFNGEWKDRNAPAIMRQSVGEIYLKTDKLDSAAHYLNDALRIFTINENKGGEVSVLTDLSELARKQGQLKTALDYDLRALELSKQFSYKRPLIYCYESLGKTYWALHEPKKSRDYFLPALKMSEELNMKDDIAESASFLAMIEEAEKNYDASLHYLKLSRIYSDSVLNEEKNRQLAWLATHFETEKKSQEIEILTKDNTLKRAYLVSSGVGTVLLLTVGILIFNRRNLKNKKQLEIARMNSEMIDRKRELAETELRARQAEELRLRADLEFKNKELMTHALHLIQKNETLITLKSKFVEIRKSLPDTLAGRLNPLNNLVRMSLNMDKDWDGFRLHFEKVNNGFFEKIQSQYPSLSAKDLKLCALMKLNLETKEIASILDISPESVKVARHRLRKKFDLPTDQSLHAFLRSL